MMLLDGHFLSELMMLLYNSQLNLLKDVEYSTIKTNKGVTYINLPCGYDIETTSMIYQDKKTAFMYVWAVGLGHGTPIIYGRTWGEFKDLLERISSELELSEFNRLVIYVHNLGYEFQFMFKHLEWLDVFSLSERKPIKALCSLGIEFRCSYVLSGFSLASTANNLVKHKVAKLVGDLDYDLIRHHKTTLTKAELQYLENDISIITAYIDEQLDIYKDISKIPMTNTGRVRTYVRNECYYSSKNHKKSSKSKYIKYRKIMGDLTLDVETYAQLKQAFMGGFTHANANHVGKVIPEVSSIDFTSSYPSVMVSEKFPMSRFKPIDITSRKHFIECLNRYAMLFTIKLDFIEPKIAQEVYISESKCIQSINATTSNGRIVTADSITITITEQDYLIMAQVYKWENEHVKDVKYAHKAYLPKAIVKSVLDLYQDKTTLKDVAGSEVEYLLSKGMLNSIYGMCVTDVVKDATTFSDYAWGVDKADVAPTISDYNGSKNRFLYYPWGVWVTAYARKNLWTGIIELADDYIYSDTDSLKLINYNNHKEYIKKFDSVIIRKMLAVCKFHGFSPSLLNPATKDGVHKTLGVWDYEGTYDNFKTLGAKRYLTQEGDKFSLTVAGLGKKSGVEYLKEISNNNPTDIFNNFNDNLYIPANRTGKMTHTYIDDTMCLQVTDYLNECADVVADSGIHLEECEFTLKISDTFKTFLNNLANGYIYKGLEV